MRAKRKEKERTPKSYNFNADFILIILSFFNLTVNIPKRDFRCFHTKIIFPDDRQLLLAELTPDRAAPA